MLSLLPSINIKERDSILRHPPSILLLPPLRLLQVLFLTGYPSLMNGRIQPFLPSPIQNLFLKLGSHLLTKRIALTPRPYPSIHLPPLPPTLSLLSLPLPHLSQTRLLVGFKLFGVRILLTFAKLSPLAILPTLLFPRLLLPLSSHLLI